MVQNYVVRRQKEQCDVNINSLTDVEQPLIDNSLTMETGFSKFFRSSLRDAEIILRAEQRIISEINILVENSQGSSQIPKSNPQLLNAEIKKKNCSS
ncbi:hypothetical protein TNCV_2603431 [Trichonephila clavipes]|nr:hypothetical protein TNCV_2603431 [Trichonephila clavipes]